MKQPEPGERARRGESTSPEGTEQLLSLAGTELPHSLECEAALLACAMYDETGGAVSIAQQAGVKKAAFYAPANRTLWSVIEGLALRRVPLSMEAVFVELRALGLMDEQEALRTLLAATSSLAVGQSHARHFADELVLLWQRRYAVVLASDLRGIALNFEKREDFAEHCGELGRKLVGLGVRGETKTLKERIDDVVADLNLRAQGKEDRGGWINFGLPTADARLRPMGCVREDGLIVIAGGSGDGKSALMRQIALGALKEKKRVAVFNRETSTDGYIEQLAALEAKMDLMDPARALREQIELFNRTGATMRDEWADKYLYCYQQTPEQPLETVQDLETRINLHCLTHGVPHLAVIDYLQLFSAKGRWGSREQEVAFVSHKLQALQRRLGCVFLVGCQLNEKGLAEMRALRRDKDDKVIHRIPNAGDLRESQAIFHDSDRVIAIYRPPVDSRDQDQTMPNVGKPEQWLCQIKRRKGGTGVVKCWFEKRYTRFDELPNFAHGIDSGATKGMTKAQFRDERGGKP